MSANVSLRSVKIFFFLFFFWLNVVLGMPSSVDTLEPIPAAASGHYHIVACDRLGCSGITGVALVDPRKDLLPVQLNLGTQQPDRWSITKVDAHVYDLSIARYPSTGVKGPLTAGDSVYATDSPLDNLRWRFIYKPEYNLFTIHSVKNEGLVWTVTPEQTPNPYIIVDHIRPDFTGQLFRFIPLE